MSKAFELYKQALISDIDEFCKVKSKGCAGDLTIKPSELLDYAYNKIKTMDDLEVFVGNMDKETHIHSEGDKNHWLNGSFTIYWDDGQFYKFAPFKEGYQHDIGVINQSSNCRTDDEKQEYLYHELELDVLFDRDSDRIKMEFI